MAISTRSVRQFGNFQNQFENRGLDLNGDQIAAVRANIQMQVARATSGTGGELVRDLNLSPIAPGGTPLNFGALVLSKGELQIISVSTEDTIPGGAVANDGISFILLAPLANGAVIFFTDRNWNGTAFAGAGGGEGTFTYTASGDQAAGTVIHISQAQLTGAGMALSDAGETIYAYQGAINAPTVFLHAVDIADGTATFDGNELLNTGLVDGVSAVSLAEDNAEFGGRTHNIQIPDLLASINDDTNWVRNDNSPQDGTASGTPAFTAPDAQIWVAGSGAGEALVTINLDATYGSGTLGYQIVQAFQNDANLFHPSDITLDTVEGKAFFVDADLAGHNRIIQINISDLLNNPGSAMPFTVLYSNAGSGATGSMRTLSVDTNNNIIYFDIGTTFNKIVYNTANQTPTVLADLTVGQTPSSNNYITQATIDYVHGTVLLGSSRIVSVFGSDLIERNYVYVATGLTSGSSSLTFTKLPFNPDDTGLGPEGTPLAGEAWPVERGNIRGIDIDPVTQIAYIVTGTVILDNDSNGLTTYYGGIYSYALTGNPTGTVTTLFTQNGSTGPLGIMYYIEVDHATGKFYVIDATGTNADPGDGAVYSGSLTVAGTPTLVATVGNFNGLGPQGLEIQHASTLAGTGLNATYTETANNPPPNGPSPNGTPVTIANGFDAHDADSEGDANADELAGAQVRISGNFQSGAGHQDQLVVSSFNTGTNQNGTIVIGGDTVTFAYNAASGVMTFTGITTLNNYENILGRLQLRTDGDNPTNYGTVANRVVSFSTFDGLLYSDEVNVTVTVTGTNDAPINTVPGTQSATEDVAKIITGFSINDVDADPASQTMTVTLSVLHGNLTLLTNVAGGITAGQVTNNGTGTVTINATQNQINATVAGSGLSYLTIADYNGADTLHIVTSDNGNNGTGGTLTDTDDVTINIAAVADIVTDNVTVAEDSGANNLDLLANDTFENNTRFISSVTQGSHGSVTINNNGTALDATDDFVVYTVTDANYNGTDSFTYTVTSPTGVFEIATVNVTLTAVNDPVTATSPTSGTVNEDVSAAITGMSIADVDATLAPAGIYVVNLSALHGTLTLSTLTGLTFSVGDGTSDTTMSFRGTLAAINTALATASYLSNLNYNGAETITLGVTDIFGGIVATGTGSASSDSKDYNFTVNAINDAPVNSVPGAQSVGEDGSRTFSNGNGNLISISDVDANGADVTVTLTVLHGTLTVGGNAGLTSLTGDGTGTVVIVGSVAEVNNALNGLLYTPTANYNGTDTLQITTDDGGNTGAPGALQDVDSVTLNIAAANDPVTGTAPATLTLAEDATNVAVTGLSISDIDATLAPAGVYEVTLSSTNGTLTLTTLTGLTFSGGSDGTADATMTFHGTLAAINTALATATYTPTANYNGTATITLNVTDIFGGIIATGSGIATSDSDVVNVTVTAVSDPVTTNAPATLTLAEDATNVAVAGLSISDVDATLAPAGVYEVTLASTHGLLTLTTLTGLTFTVGDGTADATMTFHGTLAAINTALATAQYTPDANYNGAATITLSATDLFGGVVATGTGSASSDSDVVNVTVNAVNDTPVVAVQTSVASTEQVAGFIDPAATITDVDLAVLNGGNGNYGGTALTVGRNGGAQAQDLLNFGASGAFTVNGANLEAGGLVFATFTGGNGSSLIINFTSSGTPATQALVNAVIQSLQYTYTGDTPPASIVMNYSFNDGSPGGGQGAGGSAIGTDAITINITDTPENVAPALDLDANNSTAAGTGYVGAFTEGGAAIQIVDTDVSIVDPDIGDLIEGATIAINSPVAGDQLVLGTQPGFTISGSGTGTITITGPGTAAQYQAMLALITFTNTSDDPGTVRTINITVTDGTDTSNIAVSTINITPINDEPTLTATGGTPTFTENGAAVDLFSAVTASTIEAGQTFASLTLTVTNVTDGAAEILSINGVLVALTNGNLVNVVLGNANVTVVGSTATVVISGLTLSAAQLQTLVDGLTYQNSSEIPTDANRVVTLTQVTDSGSNTPPNDNTTTLNIAATVNVDPVNDAPVNTVPGTQTINEDASRTFSTANGNAISVSDADATTLSVTLTVAHGTLTLASTLGLSFGVGDGTNDLTMTFTGTTAAINAALGAGLTYNPNANFNGSDSITVFTTDNGQSGGPTQTDNDSITVNITAINDAPVVIGDGTESATTILEDTPGAGQTIQSLFSGQYSDAADNQVPNGGASSPGQFSGIAVTANGSSGATGQWQYFNGAIWVDIGPASDAAAVLLGNPFTTLIRFNPALNFNGPAPTLTVHLIDNSLGFGITNGQIVNISAPGATGGTTAYSSGTVVLSQDVTAVNDGPANTVPVAQSLNEDASKVFSTGNGNAISVADVDATTLTVTLTVSHGTLTLSGTAGLSFGAGANGTGTMTFSGTSAQINAALNGLTYAPTANYNGPDALQIQTSDNGQTGTGGTLIDSDSVSITVVSVNDAPAGTNNTLTGSEDDPVVFTAADFGFTDPSDSPANTLLAVKITTLPGVGTLFLDSDGPGGAAPVAVIAGQFISLADINAGHLYFLGALDGYGAPYASFTFQVQDNGGTANTGVDLDQSANTMTINLTPDNLPPVVDLNGAGAGINNTTTFIEDGAAVAIGSGLTVTEQDLIPNGGSIVSARVTLTDRVAGDSLSFSTPLPGGFSVATTNLAGSITLDITGTGTAAQYQAILQSIVYSTTNQDPTVGGTDLARTITVTVNDGGLDSAVATTTVNITAVDDLPVAQPDAFTITESGSIVGGNLFASNGSGPDTDPDGPPLSISAVNGSAGNVNTTIVLASGASLTVNSNGTFNYNPGTAFLPTPTAGSGASNTPSHDSFTYTLQGGNTVTVSITLTGLDTNDTLLGTAGTDMMFAGIGSDYLDGLAGADQLHGEGGNDTYIVDNAGDQVIEAAGQGYDVVFTSISYTLAAGQEVEGLVTLDFNSMAAINLTGNEIANYLIGNAGANQLNGGAGADILEGRGGNDTYIIDNVGDLIIEAAGQGYDVAFTSISYALNNSQEVEGLSTLDWNSIAAINLTGNNLANYLIGNAGANQLDGAAGADIMDGKGGNDTYLVDNVGDVTVEAVGGGYDVVFTNISYTLTAGQEIEGLSTLDWNSTAAINLTGNEFANYIIGNAGNNILDGGAGADTLVGRGGDDSYYVDNAGDIVIEGAGGGNDSVYASANYTLTGGQEIEFLLAANLSATTALNLTGNEFANTIYGNDGANILDGKGGNDLLVGQGGADTFAFTTALGAGNVDILFGFTTGSDKIALDDAVFTAIGGLGALATGAFVTGAAAGDASDRIIYNSLTGQLFYDFDGTGAGAAVQFATLSPGLTLSASDFVVI